jgi:hypothetical protein
MEYFFVILLSYITFKISQQIYIVIDNYLTAV